MSQISGPEMKHSLRKLEYPVCAREALLKIGSLICGRAPSIKHMDLALDLMAEFIFCEVDRRGNKKPSPQLPLLELQLLEVLFDYFNGTNNETTRNAVFLSLFSGTTAMMRSTVLNKLVSIAVGIPSAPILLSASTWMQQLGNTSQYSYKLAESLVKDYFILVPSSVERLKVLPLIGPQFTANFLTAVADIYFTENKSGSFIFPPQCLLELITCWIEENGNLCITAQQKQPALPSGAIAMEATTPFAGLIKWCVLAPIYKQNSDLYGQLHLALLNSIIEIPLVNPPRAIFAQHLASPVGNICRYTMALQNQLRKSAENDRKKTLDEDLKLHICLDRFAQSVQVALSRNCVYGNIDDLVNQLQQLPGNRLITIVISTNKQK